MGSEEWMGVGGLGLAVGGLMRRHQVQSIQHSMQHSALCTLYSVLSLFQVGLTVLGRPFREVDRLIRWPEGKGWVLGIREWEVGRGPKTYSLLPKPSAWGQAHHRGAR